MKQQLRVMLQIAAQLCDESEAYITRIRQKLLFSFWCNYCRDDRDCTNFYK
jgi:hypothetical protein